MADYAHPESLVSTDWVAEHGGEANVRLVEVDVDTSAYEQGHIAGAVGWNWQSQLQQPVRRDLASKEEIEQLMGGSGIGNDTTVILYGDNNNWFAAWAFWQLKYYGHADVRLMNGGRAKWEAEGRAMTTDIPSHAATSYTAGGSDESIRAYRDQVLAMVNAGSIALVDVRSPPNSAASCWRRRLRRRKARSAADTSPALPTYRGARRWRRMALSSPPMPSASSMAAKELTGAGRPSPIAASGSAPRTPGLCLPSFSVLSMSATTTAPGPSGAASSALPSRNRAGATPPVEIARMRRFQAKERAIGLLFLALMGAKSDRI